MKALFTIKWLDRGTRFLLGAVFIYAAVGKIADPAGFAQAIANYQILPAAMINPMALFLPWLELVCGLGLITGVGRHGSIVLVALMLAVFTLALAYSAFRGLDIHCGCFATDGEGSPRLWLDIARDLVLLSLALMVLYRSRESGQVVASRG